MGWMWLLGVVLIIALALIFRTRRWNLCALRGGNWI